MPFHSQDRQDELLEQRIFRGFKRGVFVDVGAHDGVTFNNTLYFEEAHGWSGMNVEANPHVFEKLCANRPRATNVQCAIDEENGTTVFLLNDGHTEMISGIKKYYDQRHMRRLSQENKVHRGRTSQVEVPTRRLDGLLAEHGIKNVNYLSIDVEGAELAVVKSIDFSEVFIDVIGFENNYADSSIPIVQYLETRGFRRLGWGGLDVFMIHWQSLFAETMLVDA